MDLSLLFKGLSDPVRLRIAHLLVQNNELCVCHLTDALSLPQSTVSRHLNTLKNTGLVQAERRGQWVYYHMLNNKPHVQAISAIIKSSAANNPQLQDDLANIKKAIC